MNTQIETRITSVPQYRLRRLAQRALRVLERHQAKDPVLVSVAEPFGNLAREYMALYDELSTDKHVRARELLEGRQAAAELTQKVRAWVGWLVSDIDKFDASAYLGDPAVPDDALAGAQKLIDVVLRYQEKHQGALSYGDQLVAELTAGLEVARKEWTEAQDTLVARQEAQARLRVLAGQVQKNLVALRRTLRATLGTRHADYQKLRLSRATQIDIEDPEVDAGDAKPGDPAPRPGDEPDTDEVAVEVELDVIDDDSDSDSDSDSDGDSDSQEEFDAAE